MLKKILIFLIIIFIIIIGILVAYNFFFKNEDNGKIDDIEPPIPPKAVKIQVISEEPVLSPAISNGKIKYYLTSNGNIFQSNFDGSSMERLSSVILQNLLKSIWSPDKDKVISIFSDDNKTIKYFYDHDTQKSNPLNSDIQWIAWSPDSQKIAYQYYNQNNQDNYISIANPDGSEWQNIFESKEKDLIIGWPSENQISIQTRPSGLAQSALYTLNPQTKDFQKILSGIYGFTSLWSPSGDKIIFSETDENGRNLKTKLADKSGRIIQELDAPIWPGKCVWSQDERIIFCALPKSMPQENIWPDDYYKGLFLTNDDFYRINLETGQKSPLIEDTQKQKDFDASSPIISPKEDYLFFLNKKDDLLYSLKL